MDQEEFRTFLSRGGRSQSAVARCIKLLAEFEQFLHQRQPGRGPDEADPEDLRAFVAWVERAPKASAKGHLWSLCYYYDFIANQPLRALAAGLRQQRIKRTPFALAKFRGVNPDHARRLAEIGIKNVQQMLEAGRTPSDRQEIAARTGIPQDAILEFVKLSDLSRIGAIKSIRARLYYDAGIDTSEQMAQWDPKALREMLLEFVESTNFDGIAPLPKEARSAVAAAKELPQVVEY